MNFHQIGFITFLISKQGLSKIGGSCSNQGLSDLSKVILWLEHCPEASYPIKKKVL
jgi:hypothetical protein